MVAFLVLKILHNLVFMQSLSLAIIPDVSKISQNIQRNIALIFMFFQEKLIVLCISV